MSRRGLSPDLQGLVDDAVMRISSLMQELLQERVEEIASRLDDDYGLKPRGPGRPRKPKPSAQPAPPPPHTPEEPVVPAGPLPSVPRREPAKPGRRPRGRKKLVQERVELEALRRRLNVIQPAPSRPPPVQEPVVTLSIAPVEIPSDIQPPDRVDWETIPGKPLRPYEREEGRIALKVLEEYEADRPKVYADCMTAVELAGDEAWVRANPGKRPVNGKNSARPCPWVSCKHHMGTEVTESGSLKVFYDWDDGRPTCSLDIVHTNGAMTLDNSGKFFGITRERMRQVELNALMKAKAADIELEDPVEHRDGSLEAVA